MLARRTAAVVAVLVLLGAAGSSAAGAPPAAAAARKCRGRTVAWTFDGVPRCVSRARFAPRPTHGPVGEAFFASLESAPYYDEWLKPVQRPTLSDLLAEFGPQAREGVIAVQDAVRHEGRARASQANPLRPTAAFDVPPPDVKVAPDGTITATDDVGNGVIAESTANTKDWHRSDAPDDQLGTSADGGFDTSLYAKDDPTKRLTSSTKSSDSWNVPKCPTASGEVHGSMHTKVKTTISVTGVPVPASYTAIDADQTVRFVGHVGRDARLKSFDIAIDDSMFLGGTHESRSTTEITATVDVAARGRGAAASYTNWRARSTFTFDGKAVNTAASLKAELGHAEERAKRYESMSHYALVLLRRAEAQGWYRQGVCVNAVSTPDLQTIRPNQRVHVKVRLETTKGARTAGDLTVRDRFQGTVAPAAASAEVSKPARFTFTANRKLGKGGVGFGGLATSPAGRANFIWSVTRKSKAIALFDVHATLKTVWQTPCDTYTLDDATFDGSVSEADPDNPGTGRGTGTFSAQELTILETGDCPTWTLLHDSPSGKAFFGGGYTTDRKQLATGFVATDPPWPRLSAFEVLPVGNGTSTDTQTSNPCANGGGNCPQTTTVTITISNFHEG